MKTFEAQRFTSGNLLLINKVEISPDVITIKWPDIIKDKVALIFIQDNTTPRKVLNENRLFSIIINDEYGLEQICAGFLEEQVDEMISLISEHRETLKEKRASALQDALKELDQLTGLDDLKKYVREYIKLARYYKESGENSMLNMHMVFKGNPGTGKTTVARLIGRIFHYAGILHSDNFIECSRPDLVGEFIGHTGPKTHKLLESALNGILFIDEAYSLSTPGISSNDFGKEAIDTILKYMEDNRDKICVIVAGYPELMELFLEANPGLRSRFNKVVEFPDFNHEELLNIALNFFDREGVLLNKSIIDRLSRAFVSILEYKTSNFGNGRVIRNICENIMRNYDLRKAEELEKYGQLTSGNSLKSMDVNNVLSEMVKNSGLPDVRKPIGY
jgi:stage V sporulation protein K